MFQGIQPINLKEQYGDKYRIEYDPAALCEGENKNDPWYYVIPCKYGHLFPVSNRIIAFLCESGKIATRLHRDHPEIQSSNWSDDGSAIFYFTPDQFKPISGYARPKRKRRLSEPHKKRLVKSGTDALKRYRNVTLIDTKTAQKSTISNGAVSNHG